MDPFRDKVAIVTGGAAGIGEALCEELGRRGALVIVADINAAGAEQVAARITATSGQASAAQVDVSRAEDVQQIVDDTVSGHGRLDYMFNNAGVSFGGEVRDMALEHWRRLIDVNLMGVIYGMTAAYEVMVKQGSGHIVNTSSVAGLVAFPTASAYATTKHAILGLSTSLRAEAADLGVKVSAVCPGFIRTGIYDAATVVNISHEDLLSLVPFKMMDVNKVAPVILRGVARNQEIIVFPLHGRILWWLNRINTALPAVLGRRAVRELRAVRRESEEIEESKGK
jgi:NAD(P)-dependent dehydrogenase (short-subunit alcohol dehydrogenase family)